MSPVMPGPGAPIEHYLDWLDTRVEDALVNGGAPLTIEDSPGSVWLPAGSEDCEDAEGVARFTLKGSGCVC